MFSQEVRKGRSISYALPLFLEEGESGCFLRSGTFIVPTDFSMANERGDTICPVYVTVGPPLSGASSGIHMDKSVPLSVGYPGPISHPLFLCPPPQRKKPRKRERKKRLGDRKQQA